MSTDRLGTLGRDGARWQLRYERRLSQPPERASVPSITGEKIELVLVLREEKQLHLGVGEKPLIKQELFEAPDLNLNFVRFEPLRITNQSRKLCDFVSQVVRVERCDCIFKLREDF